MKQPSAPFLHLLTCTQAIKAIKAIKMANDPWDHSPSGCREGAVSLRGSPKITKPGSCTESSFGVLFRCETKQNAGRVYSIRNWISSLLAHEFRNVLIGLTQLGTRCSDGSCQAHKDLISGFSAIEAEAELVQIGLKLYAAAVIYAEQERFQVADSLVQPVQVAGFILFRVQLHARQVLIASVAVAFDFCTCRNSFANDLLKCFACDIFHDLHPREQCSPVFRF